MDEDFVFLKKKTTVPRNRFFCVTVLGILRGFEFNLLLNPLAILHVLLTFLGYVTVNRWNRADLLTIVGAALFMSSLDVCLVL